VAGVPGQARPAVDRFVENPPFQVHLENVGHDMDEVAPMVEGYRETLAEERRDLFDRFRVDRLILQVKEAQPSVLEPSAGASPLGHHGRRVVVGQRLTQAASDVFLGWCEAPGTGRQYYVRQLWDVKGQGDLLAMGRSELTYLGRSDRFDRAIADYSAACARTNEADHRALLDAIGSGRIEAVAPR